MPRIPERLRRHLLAAEAASAALRAEAGRVSLNRAFTLDGRFVGDIGEILIAETYAVDLHKKQQSKHDGICRLGDVELGVQVKCRRASDVIDFKTRPDLLLVLEIDPGWENWSVIYNGPGDVVTYGSQLTTDDDGNLLKNGAKTYRRLNLRSLRQRQHELASRGEPFYSVPERTNS